MNDAPSNAPRTMRAMAILRWVLVVLSIAAAAGSWWAFVRSSGPDGSSATHPRYHCPMHPSIVSDDPGECPICGMALERIDSARTSAATTPAATTPAPPAPIGDGGSAGFFCPMHPEVTSTEPGQRCPICKMRLEPIPQTAPAPLPAPAGLAPFTLSLDRVQAIGVRTAVATEREASPVVRVPARVEPPEQGVAQVHVRSAGFVERMSVRETGIRVSAGQELFALYSPEIWQAQAELLAAQKVVFFDAGLPDAGRAKLELLGMSPRALDEVLRTGKPMRAISVVAPTSGFVTKKNVVLGSYVTPEMPLFEIVDLSRVYVVADVFTADALDAKVGAKAKLTVTGRPELDTTGTLDLVYPRADVESRTVRVRMQVANEKMRLVPGQLGMLEIERGPKRVVTVPRDALVETGEETYVFVADVAGGEMKLHPRHVTVAHGAGEDVAIAQGLAAGERVVAGATFLVDSESRLRSALTKDVAKDAQP